MLEALPPFLHLNSKLDGSELITYDLWGILLLKTNVINAVLEPQIF